MASTVEGIALPHFHSSCWYYSVLSRSLFFPTIFSVCWADLQLCLAWLGWRLWKTFSWLTWAVFIRDRLTTALCSSSAETTETYAGNLVAQTWSRKSWNSSFQPTEGRVYAHSSIASLLWKGQFHPTSTHLILQCKQRKNACNPLTLFRQICLMLLSLFFFLCARQSSIKGIH